jgi:site-specific DNA-cytosine methylase
MNELAHIQSPLRELALFAGAGGGILGGHLLGWRCVCAVEWEPYPAGVLIARQNEGILPPFPIWDDVRSFDGRPWRGIVDVVSGGFPCQDISAAGKGAGIDGERSGMWKEMARIIGEVQPRFAFVENSPMLTSRGLDRVLADLSEMGMDAVWGTVSASDAGAPHRRERIWILAYARGERLEQPEAEQAAKGRLTIAGSCCQHPIGQLADPDLLRCLHGHAEVQQQEGSMHSVNLSQAVRMWPTPVTSMHKGSSPAALTRKSGADRSNDRLDHAVMASDGGALNPDWVEFLMNWPIGWTSMEPLNPDRFLAWLLASQSVPTVSKPSGTDKCQRWCTLHGILSTKD